MINDENSTCNCLILKPKLKSFGDNIEYWNLDICGKKMIEWVHESVSGFSYKDIEIDDTDDIVSIARNHLSNSTYTIVIYANTPLIYPETIKELLEYAIMKNVVIAKTGNVYILKTAYIRYNTPLFNDYQEKITTNDPNQFLACIDIEKYALACAIMQQNIIRAVMRNGVVVKNLTNTTIDANSYFGKNCVIEQNCNISGGVFGENCYIGVNNMVKDSTFGNNCKIGNNNTIKNCQFGDNVIIDNNNVLIDLKVGSGCILKNNCVVNDCQIDKGCQIDNSNINRVIIGENVEIAPFNMIELTQIEENVKFGNFNTISNKKIPKFTVIKNYTK